MNGKLTLARGIEKGRSRQPRETGGLTKGRFTVSIKPKANSKSRSCSVRTRSVIRGSGKFSFMAIKVIEGRRGTNKFFVGVQYILLALIFVWLMFYQFPGTRRAQSQRSSFTLPQACQC